jgi:glucose/arabinose dehydrogenase
VAFYTGTKYPPEYIGKIFVLEFSQWWIRVIEKDDNDQYVSIQDFASIDYDTTGKVTLANGPDGNICNSSFLHISF